MDATDDIAQTLTCNIGDVTQAVDVSWKNPSGADIVNGEGGYTVTTGTVESSTNIQKSTLTITSETLSGLTTTSPLTWKCAAKSTLYNESEQSDFKDLVVTFLTFGKDNNSTYVFKATLKKSQVFDESCNFSSTYEKVWAPKLMKTFLIIFTSVVEAKHSEVLKDTQATISCVVKDLTKKLDTVVWEKSSNAGVVTHEEEGYLIDVGTFDPDTKSQTTILTIPADKNTADSVYTCVITSIEHGKTAERVVVNSNVFSKFWVALF